MGNNCEACLGARDKPIYEKEKPRKKKQRRVHTQKQEFREDDFSLHNYALLNEVDLIGPFWAQVGCVGE